MRIRLLARALLVAGCGGLVLVAAEPAASQALCDPRGRGPAETAAYSAIRDLLDADHMVLEAREARYKKQNHLSASLTDFFVALEREARAAECAASLLEPYATSLVSLYREVATSAREFRKFVTTAAFSGDVTRENEATWHRHVTNYMVGQKLFDEDARRGVAKLTDLSAAIAAIDPSCLAPGHDTCERNRLAITREERARLLAALTAVPGVKLTKLRTVLEGPTPALDDDIAVWLFDVDDASLPELRWVGALDRDACDTAFRKAGEPKSETGETWKIGRPCRPMLLVQDGAHGVGESVWVSTISHIVFLTPTQSTCEAFRAWKARNGGAPAPCESFRLSTAR